MGTTQRHKMPEDAAAAEDDVAALKAQLAAAEAELQQHRDEKEQFQKELESAQKEKEEADLKLGYLNKIGLTEEEFQEKKSSATGKIEVKLDELRGRKIALDRALEQSPLLSKQIISGSMMMQKDIQEQLGKLKTHIDERQKMLLSQVKLMEEQKLCTIQNCGSELRSARGKLVDRISSSNSEIFENGVCEIFERCEQEEALLDEMLSTEMVLQVEVNTDYDGCSLELVELSAMIDKQLDFNRSDVVVSDEPVQDPQVALQGKAQDLKDQMTALIAEKKKCVEMEDFLEADRKKKEIDVLQTELETIMEGLPAHEDANDAKKRAKYEAEIQNGLNNWDAVRYKKERIKQTQKGQGSSIMSFLF